MVFTGIILYIAGVVLTNFLTPKENVRARMIQMRTEPKVFAQILTYAGIAIIILGVLRTIFFFRMT
jgi:hypothetical protein